MEPFFHSISIESGPGENRGSSNAPFRTNKLPVVLPDASLMGEIGISSDRALILIFVNEFGHAMIWLSRGVERHGWPKPLPTAPSRFLPNT
jgi:hypothetical protein